jgi:protein-tyrosine phosphatase
MNISAINDIVIVCIGNICRSPMAAALLTQALADGGNNGIRVHSAGLTAVVGHPPSAISQRLMRERGLDISAWRALQLTERLLAEADLILVMETDQKKWIELQSPTARGKVYRLGEWSNFEVPDPIGRSAEFFNDVLLLIDQGISDWVPKLKRG